MRGGRFRGKGMGRRMDRRSDVAGNRNNRQDVDIKPDDVQQPSSGQMNKEDELAMLRQQAQTIQNQLQSINTRIDELIKGKSVRQTAYIDHAVCTGCGRCVQVCPQGAVTLVNSTAHVDRDACTGCGICVTECPKTAISMQNR